MGRTVKKAKDMKISNKRSKKSMEPFIKRKSNKIFRPGGDDYTLDSIELE